MNENITDKNKPEKKRSLTPQEQTVIARLRQKQPERPVTIYRTKNSGNTETLNLALEENLVHEEAVALLDADIMSATGSAYDTVGLHILTNLSKAIVPAKANLTEMASILNTVAQSMQALAPQDEFEGQLVAQLVVLHEHAMDWLGRAMRTERVDFANVYLNGASKLLTRHHETLDALLKYRRRGGATSLCRTCPCQRRRTSHSRQCNTGGGVKPIVEEGPHATV